MRSLFLIISILVFCSCSAFAQDYAVLYDNQEPANFKLIKGIDPFQEKDYLEYAWAPYPLFRSSRTLIYKEGDIPPGYYLLVPREMKGKTYIFFKENGSVKYIVPVYKEELLPPNFYEQHIPKPSLTKRQKLCESAKKKFYKVFKDSKQQEPPKAFITTAVVDNDYYELILYYDKKKYYTIYKLKKD